MPIRNTSNLDEADMLTAVAVGAPEFVTAQEKQGQIELVNSTRLPTKGSEDLEQIGVVLGPIDEKDPLFREVNLPEGWKKEGTDHSLHSNVVDQNGNVRITVFYKAAMYDRAAFCTPIRRLQHHTIYPDIYDDPDAVTQFGIRVRKSDEPLVIICSTPARRSLHYEDEVDQAINDYMEKHAPDWLDYDAYWDEIPELPQLDIIRFGPSEEEE